MTEPERTLQDSRLKIERASLPPITRAELMSRNDSDWLIATPAHHAHGVHVTVNEQARRHYFAAYEPEELIAWCEAVIDICKCVERGTE